MTAPFIETHQVTDGEPKPLSEHTLLRPFLSNWSDALRLIVGAAGGSTARKDSFSATDYKRPTAYLNSAILLQSPRPGDWRELVAELDTFFEIGSGDTFGDVYLWSAWPTPDLTPWGWRFFGSPPLMMLPTFNRHPPRLSPLTVRKVDSPGELADFSRVIREGYSLSNPRSTEHEGMFPLAVLADDRVHLWVGYDAGCPVATSAAFVAHGINDVKLIATVPEARGRGFGKTMTWHASVMSEQLPGMLLSSDQGRTVYEAMGYSVLDRFTGWYRSRG